MKLPFGTFFQKEEKKEYFLALLFRDEKITAWVFEQVLGKIQVIGEAQETFKTSVEDTSFDQLLEILDKAISVAESALPPNIETKKTIFGVKEDWVEEGKIKKDHLSTLKKVCDALGLSPIGFLTFSEAIAHLLYKEEGAPVTAILVENGKNATTVSLIRAGNVVETKKAPIEESTVKTVDKLLQHFSSLSVLPSRIIIFDGENSQKLMQEFIAHQWSKSLPFLHVPQVTVLPKGFDARAVLFGTAAQMGFEVLDIATTEAPAIAETPAITENTVKDSEDTEEESVKTVIAETFGFVKEKDIALLEERKESLEVEKGVEKIETKEIPDESKEEKKFFISEIEEDIGRPTLISSVLTILKNTFAFIFKIDYGKILSPFLKTTPLGKFIFVPPIVLLIAIALLLLYVFNLKATVTLNLQPKKITEQQSVTISRTNPSLYDKNIIKGEDVSIELEGEASYEATGKKEVGEKAKGQVTIYNSDLKASHTFPKGTTITSPNGLKFVLDSTVSLASASGDASSITSSTAKTSVAASDIGKEYNLPSGTKFGVSDESTSLVLAKNDQALSGGAKKEITVISDKDLDNTLKALTDSLVGKAQQEITKKGNRDSILISDFLETEVTKKDFDKKEGDEAQKVGVKGVVSFKGIAIEKSALDEYSKTLLRKIISDNLTLSESGVKAEIKNAKKITAAAGSRSGGTKSKDLVATIEVKANLIPKLDRTKIVNDIKGKSFDEARETLRRVTQVSDIDFSLSPPLPLLPERLPQIGENIKIEHVTNE